MHLSPTSELGYLSFNTVGLHCLHYTTTKLIPACQAERQFVPFYDGLKMTRPTTKSSRRCVYLYE